MKRTSVQAAVPSLPSSQVLLSRPGILRLAIALSLSACAIGCSGSDGRVPVYPVKGKVTVKGEVPVGALVVLHSTQAKPESADVSRPSGKVAEDGSFALTTYEAGDGAPAGEYTATLQWNKLVKRGNDFVAGPDVVPPAYTSPEQSPWKASVRDGATELPPLDIK